MAAAEVYKVLATDNGVNRAFDKLSTIKNNVVWWNTGAQPPQLLANGEVVMTAACGSSSYSGHTDWATG